MHFKCFTEWWFQNPFEKIYRKLNRFKPEFLVSLVEYLWPLSITLPLLLPRQWNKKSSTWLISWLTAFAIFWLLLLLFARNWLWQVNCSGISHWNIYLTPPLNTPWISDCNSSPESLTRWSSSISVWPTMNRQSVRNEIFILCLFSNIQRKKYCRDFPVSHLELANKLRILILSHQRLHSIKYPCILWCFFFWRSQSSIHTHPVLLWPIILINKFFLPHIVRGEL